MEGGREGGGRRRAPLALQLPAHPPPSAGAPVGDHQCYIVQAYVPGGTLKRAVHAATGTRPGEPRPYTHADAAAWGAQLARGLAYLHGANPVVLHRDLKLENVLLTARAPAGDPLSYAPGRGQTAQLADFGLAVSFTSPYIQTRRSKLPPRGGAGGDRLGDRRASAVAEQMQRADAGQAMTDGGVAKAAGALESRLSAWPTSAPAPAPTPAPSWGRLRSLHATNRAVFALTGKTGSYLYMAPCVTLSLPYNEQADLFSLGCVLWELFSGRTIASVVLAGGGGDPGEGVRGEEGGGARGREADPRPPSSARVAELYAHRVARGFRPPIPETWPEPIRSLVAACWRGAPGERPRAREVAEALDAALSDGTLAAWDEAAAAEDGGGWSGGRLCCACM